MFDKGKFDLAAEQYAKSDRTFEEVTLKFLQNNHYYYLEIYLQRTLSKIDTDKEELTPTA